MPMEVRPRAVEVAARLRAFVREVVEPGECRYWEEHAAFVDRWTIPPVMDEMKAATRAAGLWNLFLPESEYGAV
jgi:acyl-CoA dehydrogenase